jgi:hypothetical protein
MTCREFIASPRNSPRKAQLLIGGDVNTAACGLFAALRAHCRARRCLIDSKHNSNRRTAAMRLNTPRPSASLCACQHALGAVLGGMLLSHFALAQQPSAENDYQSSMVFLGGGGGRVSLAL